MNKFRSISLAFWLTLFMPGAWAWPQEPNSSSIPHDELAKEATQTKTALEKVLTETRWQIAQIEREKAAFQQTIGTLTQQIHAFRLLVQQRKSFFDKFAGIMAQHTQEDSSIDAEQYWKIFFKNLEQELTAERARQEEEISKAYEQLSGQYEQFIKKLSQSGITHPYLGEVVVKLIKGATLEPLKPTAVVEVLAETAKLREQLVPSRWGPQIHDTVANLVAEIGKRFSEIDKTLGSIEKSIMQFHERVGRISAQLGLNLAKADTLLGALQVLERNMRSLKNFDPAQVRQQLVFLLNQNQFLEYPHRVLKSYSGEIESAVNQKNWPALLSVIAQQDPDFGALNFEKNAYILFVGVNDLNQRFLLHTEHDSASDYLYAIGALYGIWLEDNPRETYRIDMSVELLQSEFELTFGQFKTLSEARTRGAKDIPPEPTLFFYGMKKIRRISSPAKIYVGMQRMLAAEVKSSTLPASIEETNEVFKTSYRVHERSLAHVSVGLAAGFVEFSNFVIENKQLRASPKGEKELDQQLYALFNFHLGARDVDRFDQYARFDYRKFMLQGGIGVSQNPLDRLYLGWGYRLFKETQIDFLYFWRREPNRAQTVSLEEAASLDDAKQKFEKVYQAGNFAIGLSFYPRRLFGFLGL